MKVDGELLEMGSYRPDKFRNIVNIVVARINQIETLKKSGKHAYLYMLDEIYPVFLNKPEIVDEMIFGLVEKNEKIDGKKYSLTSNGFNKTIKYKR